jgi:hypothetical protein
MIIMLLSITSAQAELVNTDWENAGDNLATLDTETGIEWLDLTQTDGMSINHVESLLNSTFSGWRLPTSSEVTEMLVNAFPSESNFYEFGTGSVLKYSATVNTEVTDFTALFGVTRNSNGNDYTYGIFKSSSNPTSNVMFSGARKSTAPNEVILFSNINASSDLNSSWDARGVYLVSDGGTTLSSQLDPSLNANNANAPAVADVPVPTTLGLMGLGVLGFVTRRRLR